jgi:hypothetical protein
MGKAHQGPARRYHLEQNNLEEGLGKHIGMEHKLMQNIEYY